MKRERRKLTAAEKRALASSGLIVTRYQPNGRARLEQLTAEAREARRPSLFLSRQSNKCSNPTEEGG
jgi:hypothetical protein